MLIVLTANGCAFQTETLIDKKIEADNGWGTVDGTLNFFIQILREWEYFKMFYPELENIATFWIE